jgi:hypothetical protein
MTITVLGATGKLGTLVARGLLAEGQRVRALVRDPGKARDRLGPDSRLEIITGDLGTPAGLEGAFRGADAACVAPGSASLEGNLTRLAILAAGRAALPQSVRLSVLNTRPHRWGSTSARTGTSTSPPLASPTPRSAGDTDLATTGGKVWTRISRISPGFPGNGADHDRSLHPEAVRAPAATCSGHGRGRYAASADDDRTA